MEPTIDKKLEELDAKISAIYASVEKTRKYFLAVIWITVLTFVLPAIGLIFVLPSIINSYIGVLGGI